MSFVKMTAKGGTEDLLCFGEVPWRNPQTRTRLLMERWAQELRVLFFDPPSVGPCTQWKISDDDTGVRRVQMSLASDLLGEDQVAAQRAMLDQVLKKFCYQPGIAWYCRPLALSFSRHVAKSKIIYDMSANAAVGPGSQVIERKMVARADLIFTAGHDQCQFMAAVHHNVHAAPNSIDLPTFVKARDVLEEPEDQAKIPHPRIGFHGDINERLDFNLVRAVALANPQWHFVLLDTSANSPNVARIKLSNVHHLTNRSADDLPRYISGWDVGMLPFVRTGATRFFSPTTPLEYIAAAKPIVSTALRDVVRPYAQLGFVKIADGPDAFSYAIRECLLGKCPASLSRINRYLLSCSWDATWRYMSGLVRDIDSAADRQYRKSA